MNLSQIPFIGDIIRRGEAEWDPESHEAPIVMGTMAIVGLWCLYKGLMHLSAGVSVGLGRH